MVHIQLFLIHMALWKFVLFFQSPDIITSHIPLSDITNPSWALSFLSPLSLPTSITHPSSVRPAGQVCVKLTSRGCGAP